MNARKILIQALLGLSLTALSSKAMANGTTPKEDCQNAGYDKGFFIKSCDDEFKLVVNIHLTPQYQFLMLEDQDPDTLHTFQLRYGRLNFSGHAFTPDLTYFVQFEVIGGKDNTTKQADPLTDTLREAYLNYKFSEAFQLRGGEAKPFFNREELSSSSKLQFAGRSFVNKVFTTGYGIGLFAHGKTENKKLEYGVSVTNDGDTRNKTNENDLDVLIAGRVVYNIAGEHGYTMSDIKNSQDLQLAIGAGAYYETESEDYTDDAVFGVTADIAAMYKGFSFLAEGHYASVPDLDESLMGILAQAGYFFIPEKFEVAARFAGIMPSSDAAQNGYEITGGLNYYFKGHNLKFQLDYGLLLNSPLVVDSVTDPKSVFGGAIPNPGFVDDQTDHRVRAQVQLYF